MNWVRGGRHEGVDTIVKRADWSALPAVAGEETTGPVRLMVGLEVGLGRYLFMYEESPSFPGFSTLKWFEESPEFSDPVLGFRFALGTSFYFGRFYIGPEISYHVARYTDWSYKPEDGGSFDFESDEIGDVVLFLLKLGYHFRR